MNSAAAIQEPTVKAVPEKDLTGRSRLVSNVLFTWGGQMVFFVSGFIMPRLIDHKLGKNVLGVWDFSWSLVTYFRFVDMGIAASVNRYVARFWGKQDIAGINRVVSSATLALSLTGLLMFIGTLVAVKTLPLWFGTRLDEYVDVTQWSVFWLGSMLSAGTALGAFNGVLTGCHRWELQTMRTSVWQFISVTAMIIALFLGAGLATLAAITAIAQTLGQLTMVTLAYRACPGLQVKRSSINGGMIKELYFYSGKTLLPTISDMLQNQTISVMILGALGPGALAIFTRPRALLRQMDSLERRMAMILVPTASSLEGCDDREGIISLMIKATRYSLYLALPLLFVLIFFGGFVMKIWMGPAYALNLVPAILAVGFIGVSVMEPVLSILVGLNAHGRGGLAMVIASLMSVVIAFVLQKFYHAGLVGMACAITGPLLIAHLVYIPWMACRHLSMNLGRFYAHAIGEPMLHVLPFAIALAVARLTFRNYPVVAILALAAGGTALGIFYWHRVVPGRVKKWALRFVGRKAAASV